MLSMGIILAAVVVGGIGIVIGIVLGVAGEKFKVEIDPREEAVLDALPGNNCGACGFPGCSGLAAAIAKEEAPVNACPVGGAAVADVVGGIMGVAAGESTRMVRQHRTRQHRTFDATRGNDRQRHGDGTLADARNILYGQQSFDAHADIIAQFRAAMLGKGQPLTGRAYRERPPRRRNRSRRRRSAPSPASG